MPEKNGNKFPKTRPGYINALFKVEKNQCSFTIKKNRLNKKTLQAYSTLSRDNP